MLLCTQVDVVGPRRGLGPSAKRIAYCGCNGVQTGSNHPQAWSEWASQASAAVIIAGWEALAFEETWDERPGAASERAERVGEPPIDARAHSIALLQKSHCIA